METEDLIKKLREQNEEASRKRFNDLLRKAGAIILESVNPDMIPLDKE